MMRLYALVVVLGACGFSPSETAAQPDAQSVQPGMPASDANMTTTTTPHCHVGDPSLVLCLDFEDATLDPTVADLSPTPHVASSTDLTASLRSGQQAASFQAQDSRVHLADAVDLSQMAQVTFETFIDLDVGSSAWPIDNNGNYGIGLSGTKFYCYARGIFADTTASIAGAWHHIACTFDGQQLNAYLDGKRVRCATPSDAPTAPPAGSGDGIDLGAYFIGQLDDIHIYSTALPESAIASHAGVNPIPDQPNCP